MQAKKRTQSAAPVRTEDANAKPARPVGMQTMGTALYEQLRRVLVEMKLVSEN
jgi:hypothetical protein